MLNLVRILFIIAIISLGFLYKSPSRPPLSPALIYLDFNGNYSDTAIITGKNYTRPSELGTLDRGLIINNVRQYFHLWDVKITTSEKEYYSFPTTRVKCVITEDTIPIVGFLGDTIGWAQGISPEIGDILCDTLPSYVSSGYRGDGYQNQIRPVSDCIVHEIGHRLGLMHQSEWIYLWKTREYAIGDSLEAPIMGVSCRSKKAVWTIGLNSLGLLQNDTEIISKTFKRIH